MKFSQKCIAIKLGMIFTIFGSFCSFLNWEGTLIELLDTGINLKDFMLDSLKCFVMKKKGIFSDLNTNSRISLCSRAHYLR